MPFSCPSCVLTFLGGRSLVEKAHLIGKVMGRYPLDLSGEKAGHLRLIVHEYIEHYHRERNHQGLDNQLLQRPPPPVRADADVQRRERLGGLLSFYYREAA